MTLHPERLDIAKVSRHGALPVVEICNSMSREGTELELLQAARKEYHLDKHRCATLLDKHRYQFQLLDAPSVAEAEMKSAVRWRLKDFLDYPVESATVDVLMVPTDETAPIRGRSVFAVAARNQDVEACMKLFSHAKIPLGVIDIAETAQRNIATLFETDQRAVAMLSFLGDSGLLTFSARGELYLSRRIEVTLDQLLQSTAETRTSLFERIALELQRSLDHMDRQFSYVPIGRVLIAPLPEDIPLAEYLKSNVSSSVERANLAEVLDFQNAPGLADAGAQMDFWLTLGAALRAEAGGAGGR